MYSELCDSLSIKESTASGQILQDVFSDECALFHNTADVILNMMLQRVMIYVCEYRMLHDKEWLIKWVRCWMLLNFQCDNMINDLS